MKKEITNLVNGKGSDILSGEIGDQPPGMYLTTREAAVYLRRSVSWLLRQTDIPFLPGNPKVYSRGDLDRWFERHKLELGF